MTTTERTGSRILVSAGSFVDANAALDIVEWLATGIGAGIGGILVEEVDTLAVCQIPNQRIVLISGTTVLAPDPAQVRTLIDADARAFQKCLTQTAKASGTKWTFTQEAGDLVPTALRVAVGWDILVIGYRHVHGLPGKIVVLNGASPACSEMEAAARLLSLQLSAGQIILSVNPTAKAGDTAHNSSTFRFEKLKDAMDALARTNAQAVLVDMAHGPVQSPEDLARLLEVSRCPLIVFGASSANAMLEHGTQIPSAVSNEGPTDAT